MPLFAFFYECPVKVVNVFSLKRLLFILIYFLWSVILYIPPLC